MATKNPHVGGVQMPLFVPDSSWAPPSEFPELVGPQAWDLETWDPDLTTLGPGWIPGGRGRIAGYSVSADNFTGYFPVAHEGGGNLDPDVTRRWVQAQVKKPAPKIFANAPYDVGWLTREGIELDPTELHDVQLQAPLLNEYRSHYALDSLAKDYLEGGKDTVLLREALASYGLKDMGQIARLPAPYVGPYAEVDASKTRELWHLFNRFIEEEDLGRVYELERSLIMLMVAMRRRGMPVNVPKAERLHAELKTAQRDLLAKIRWDTGVDVEPWIPQTIERALQTRGVSCPRTVRGDPSITADWLESLDDPIARDVLKVRKLDKAAGTFVQNYVLDFQRNGRIHAQFNQLRSDDDARFRTRSARGTVSGRFSSDTPNLQNIPIRDPEIGWLIRDLFVPEEGERWASVDYSSQEPRLTVHFAAVTMLTGADEVVRRYHENSRLDFHQMVADICGIPRDQAKPINLGIAYGMGGAKLCRQLGLPTTWIEVADRDNPGHKKEIEVAGPEGQAILDRVNENAPFISKLAKLCQNRANSRGFIVTIAGRRCRFEKVSGRYQYTHKALNRLIQGSAADQMKEAMRQLYHEHGVVPLATVHDELCLSVPSLEVARRYTTVMENAIPLLVPVVADIKLGDSWGTTQKQPH